MDNVEYIIFPNSKYKLYWDFYIFLLLIYTATVLPYVTCFYETKSHKTIAIESFMDFSWFIDIILTFFTAIKDKNNRFIVKKNIIASRYLKSWFFIDVATTFPWALVAHAIGGQDEHHHA